MDDFSFDYFIFCTSYIAANIKHGTGSLIAVGEG